MTKKKTVQTSFRPRALRKPKVQTVPVVAPYVAPIQEPVVVLIPEPPKVEVKTPPPLPSLTTQLSGTWKVQIIEPCGASIGGMSEVQQGNIARRAGMVYGEKSGTGIAQSVYTAFRVIGFDEVNREVILQLTENVASMSLPTRTKESDRFGANFSASSRRTGVVPPPRPPLPAVRSRVPLWD